ALFMFSLTGLPPLAGFWGKFTLFTAALGVDAKSSDPHNLWKWFLALAIVGALNAAISAAYYLRVVGTMYFRAGTSRPEGRGGQAPAWATALCAALVIGIGCSSGPSIDHANGASQSARLVPAPGEVADVATGDEHAEPTRQAPLGR